MVTSHLTLVRHIEHKHNITFCGIIAQMCHLGECTQHCTISHFTRKFILVKVLYLEFVSFVSFTFKYEAITFKGGMSEYLKII